MPTDQRATALQQAFAAFLLDKEIAGCTRFTLLWYREYVGRLVTWLAAHDVTTPAGITLAILRAYIADVQGRGLAPKTVHHHAAAAKTFCKWLAAEGLVTSDPAERLPRPKVPKKVLPALAPDEVKKLLDACECERDTALLLFMLDTGARCAETVAVNVGDVDTRTGAVTIVKGKGQKGRTVYIGVRARKALLKYLLTRANAGAAAPLWTSQTSGERLGRWGVMMVMRRLQRATGVQVSPHKLRRTFAIASLRAGMDVARVAALLGHSDLAAVQRYLAIVESDLEAAHREHGAVDSLLAKKGR
jgi:integrase/recombinase XerD